MPADDRLYQAATILASLDQQTAAEICRHLDRETVERLATEIAALPPVGREQRTRLLGGFLRAFREADQVGGREYAQQLLSEVLGAQLPAQELLGSSPADLRALQTMAEREPHVLWRALEHETRQVSALALAQLRPREAARLLELIPEEQRLEVAYRAATLGPTAPGAVEALLRCLLEATHRPVAEEGAAGEDGLQFLLEVLQNVERGTERQLLEGLKEVDQGFAEAVEEKLVTFEDLFSLEDRALQTLLRQIETATLALALRGVDERIREKALANVSARMREELEQEMELLGPVRVAQVEGAQRSVTALARELAERGELELRAEPGEYI